MPRARTRKKGRGSTRVSLVERHGSRDNNADSEAPIVKGIKMDEEFPLSPGKSFKERITDYFNPALKLDHNYVLVDERVNNQEEHRTASPPMPVLLPMVVPRTLPPCLRLMSTDSEIPLDNSPPILSPRYPTECPNFLLDMEQLPNFSLEHAAPDSHVYQDPPQLYQEQVDLLYAEYEDPPPLSNILYHQELCHQPLIPPQVEMTRINDVQDADGDGDGASDRSEGDSGKENEAEDRVSWRGSRSSLGSRGSRPRSGHHAATGPPIYHASTGQSQYHGSAGPAQLFRERSQGKAPVLGDNNSGRVTRSKRNRDDDEEPLTLTLLNCERLEHFDKCGTPSPRSPPTPHKIKMPNKIMSPANALQKLKISSQGLFARTPKKTSTKVGKSTKRLGSSAPEAKPPAPHTKAAKLASAAESSRKVTEYFPIRRSERKPKNEQLKEQMEGIEARLLATDDTGLDLEVVTFPEKGRGVVSTRDLKKGEFVVEYAGDIIDVASAKEREFKYSLDVSKGCYMYYFKHKGKNYCIDGTSESGRLGRLVNHSCKQPNMVTKVVELGQDPRLILIAKQDISAGIELLYDYGDRDKESLKAHPWLTS